MKVILNFTSCPEDERYSPDIDLTGSKKVSEVNIGAGADWVVTLIEYAGGILTLFSLPTIINEGIRDWRLVINRLKKYHSKKKLISVDEDGAACLAIDYLAEKYGEEAYLEIIAHYVIPLVDLSGMINFQDDTYASRPYNYYVQAYSVNGIVKILGIRHSGEIKEIESFAVSHYGIADTRD